MFAKMARHVCKDGTPRFQPSLPKFKSKAVGSIRFLRAQLLVRLVGHLQRKRAPGRQLAVSDIITRDGLAIETAAIDINIILRVVFCLDDELLASCQARIGRCQA